MQKLFYGTDISISMDYTFPYTSSSYVNRTVTSSFFDSNKKYSLYVGLSKYFFVKYSHDFFNQSVYSANKSIQQINSSSIY
uniref:NADH dehydrogenase subunit 5 n=1 Tax=Cymbaria daurica TaxID=2867398 RepID=UPI0020375F82|nr:NADH dehydrogenase subunit 5 [Cymbaria daurica]URC16255.1 NADH dehydrogenase subunit 5 [Cymbaria daurica]